MRASGSGRCPVDSGDGRILALGVIGRPELLFLDEPTTGLDPEARRQMWEVIDNLIAAGTTVLLSTHYLDEAARLARRVIVLSDGRIVADAAPGWLRSDGGVSTARATGGHLGPADTGPTSRLPGLATARSCRADINGCGSSGYAGEEAITLG